MEALVCAMWLCASRGYVIMLLCGYFVCVVCVCGWCVWFGLCGRGGVVWWSWSVVGICSYDLQCGKNVQVEEAKHTNMKHVCVWCGYVCVWVCVCGLCVCVWYV